MFTFQFETYLSKRLGMNQLVVNSMDSQVCLGIVHKIHVVESGECVPNILKVINISSVQSMIELKHITPLKFFRQMNCNNIVLNTRYCYSSLPNTVEVE